MDSSACTSTSWRCVKPKSLVRSPLYASLRTLIDSSNAEESPLAPAALHCLCSLVQEKPDFNLAINIMDVVVKRVGRKGWDDVSSLFGNCVRRLTPRLGASTLSHDDHSSLLERHVDRRHEFTSSRPTYLSPRSSKIFRHSS